MLLSADVSQTAKVCQVIRPARRLRSVSCQAARADGSGSAGETLPDEPPHSRQLANGQGFMLDEAAAAHDVVYGQNFGFVMTRPRRSTRGLVRCPGAHMQPFRGKEQRSNLSLALRAMQAQTGMVPFGFAGVADGSIVIDTWAEDVTASSGSGSDTAAGACLGIVPYIAPGQTDADASSDEDVWVVETSSSSNPRRTHRVKFTCNLCGCTTIAPVNPHAMANGSVFARCGGCDVIHKLKDNLNLFLEVKGPIFSPRPRVAIPKSLPQIPGRGLHGARIGGVPILDMPPGGAGDVQR